MEVVIFNSLFSNNIEPFFQEKESEDHFVSHKLAHAK